MNMDERKKIAKVIQSLADMRAAGQIIGVTEAAELLGVSHPVASDLVRRGLLDAVTPAPIPRLVTRSSVETYKTHRDAKDKAGRYDGDNAPPRYDN